MATTEPAVKTRDRILQAAQDLFYRQGYQATVVNQIIEEAGVSKPTFYAHFPSKEELCTVYLREMRKRDMEDFREMIRLEPDPMKKYLTPIMGVREHMISSAYRGCGYFNMLVEVVDRNNPIVREVEFFTEGFREMLRDVTVQLRQSDPAYGQLNVSEVADDYYVILGGAIMVSQEYQAEWPLDSAVRQVERLVR